MTPRLKRTRRSHERDRILTRRLRLVLWAIVATLPALAVVDAMAAPRRLVAVYAYKVLLLGAAAWALRSMRPGRESARDGTMGLIVLSLATILTGASGVAYRETVGPSILLLVLCVGAAGFLPWGVRRQTVLSTVTAATIVAMVWIVHGRLEGAIDRPGIVVFVGLAVSLFVAREGDRLRNERRRAQRALDHRTSDLQSISDAMSRYLADGTLTVAVEPLLHAAREHTSSPAAFIARVAPGGSLEMLVHAGLRAENGELRADAGGEFLDRVLRRGLSVLGNDLDQDPDGPARGLPPTVEPMRCFLAVPIRRSSSVVGMIGVANRLGGYSRVHTSRLDLLAQTAGVLFGSDEADRARRADEAVTTALAGVGRELMSLLDRPRLLDRMCELTTHALDCDSSHTLMLDAERGRYRVIAGYGDTPEEWEVLRVMAIPTSMMTSFVERFSEQETEEVVPSDDDWLRSPARRVAPQFGVTSSLLCPLRRGEEIVGFLVAANRGRPRRFGESQRRILEGIGRLASMALHNAALVEELARANEVRSEFIATMSHELRTPLNVVIGYSNMLEDGTFGDLSTEQITVLQRIDRNARELHELISTTLDLTRLESGRVTVEVGEVDLEAVLQEVLSELEPVRGHEVQLLCDVTHPIPTLETDELKLKVVVKNLIRNAIKFTDAGSVEVRAYPVERGVEICVADTGIGIGPDAQETVFEAFQQVQPGQEGRGGVGLGLHIVRRLVELLDGSVRLESTLGEGSRFFVRLPLPADVGDVMGSEQRRTG